METILLIGGTGLMGPAVVRELEELGQNVICINREGKHPTKGYAYTAERSSVVDLRNIFRRFEAFTLIDMIPYTAVQAAKLLESLNGKQPRLVAVSSIDVYQAYNNLHSQGRPIDEFQKVPLLESSALRSRVSFQGLEYDKLNVERIYSSYFDQYAILRMPAIYGLPDTSRIERYFSPLVSGDEIVMHPGLAKWRFSRSLNLNCAHAISLCADFNGREFFNVAEEKHYSEKEWCLLIADLLGKQANFRFDATAAVPFDMNTGQHWTVDSSKIRSTVAYTEKYNPEQGIREVLSKLHQGNTDKCS